MWTTSWPLLCTLVTPVAVLSSSMDVNTLLYNKTGKWYISGNKNAACKYKLC